MLKWISPFCLFLALAMLIAGFAVWAGGAPEQSVELHAARVTGDDGLIDVLEAQFAQQVRQRKLLLICLFGGSVMMVLVAFLSMRPSDL